MKPPRATRRTPRRSVSAPASITSRIDYRRDRDMNHSTTAFRTNARARILAGFAASLLLVACGADQVAGIQGSGAPVASGVTSVGTVTGFGSVFVDGVEYGTSSAQIRLDD